MMAQKKAKAFSNFAFKGVVSVVATIYILLFGLSFWNIHDLNKKLNGYENVLKKHKQKEKEKGKYAKELGAITKSLELSGSIKSNKSISFRTLAQVTSAVPKRVKFEKIEYDGNRKIIVTGLGSSDQDILKLIANLNNKKLIKQATLANMSLPKASSGSPSMKGFKVVCLLESS